MFLKAGNIIKRLEDHGFEAYFVGGSIRDYLLNRPIGDIDIATSALPNDVINLFEKTVPVGLQHGTVVVIQDGESYEVTTFRKEEDYLDYRRPSLVKFVSSLKEDLMRRDFTMNAIAMNRTGKIIDLFEGQKAIEEKSIQTVGEADERFNEDALRMMRALRFQSQLTFQIETRTHQAITKHAALLQHVSVERITVEFEKLIKGKSCHQAIQSLVATGLDIYLPNLEEKKEKLLKWPELSYSSLQTRSELWALVCLLLEVRDTFTFLQPWKLPTKVMKETAVIVDGVKEIQSIGWKPFSLYENGKEVSILIERVNSIILGNSIPDHVQNVKRQFDMLPISSRTELVISGRDIIEWGKKNPGPWVAKTLHEIEKEIVNGKLENKQEHIKEWLLQCNRL
ncbi:CCA tRNA nucleotidyltransferase [Bacillus suaedaesalsae]|uniref:CCA-adding enzyme n=1 Tax=Bacillus suaedaesalsae TaxID=2810349 RepID=A0ABS2DMU2_9BACI|nr:CCA tRNA nucleotidyltransferase [Bacillus suaedaesalsae]MBM6619835.1 CCA tRNA nucleotidyltransferase [Bacillus suaedaesalsae]